ncbi:MAG: transglycosylase SLT domain-containing protein [Lachnospiraceae bacterium]|nr:transglycosylase SLT domain-containing protein [Lachnospiraceae bacterium]
MKFALLIIVTVMPLMADATTISREEIIVISKKYEYDKPLLVAAIVDKEAVKIIKEGKTYYKTNSYHPEKSGSYGLMQIQCDTAKSPEFKKDALVGKCDQLFNAETNIKYGIMWLKFVESKLIVPSIRNIMAGYNAGFDVQNKRCNKTKNNKCVEILYATRRCTKETTFHYEGHSPMKCLPGQYINEVYVRDLYYRFALITREEKGTAAPK